MPSSFTASLRFEAQFTGENINVWGVKLDNTFARMDDAIAGFTSITIAGDYTLQSATDNTVSDEARRAHLKLIGTPANNFATTIPSVPKSYWFWNATLKVATITTGSGTTVGIDPGDITQVWCDGTNVNTHTFGGLSLKTFITAQTAAAGAVPGTVGALGKFLKVVIDGSPPTWQPVSTLDLSDYATKILGTQVALAVAL